jgi:hypothetical protein
MSLELVNTLATFGTFVVIAATAIAAIVQLRHARSSNHIAALNELRETQEAPEFQAAQHFVNTGLPAKLQDPAFRYQIVVPSARTDETRPLISSVHAIGNYYEGMGVLVKTGLVDNSRLAGRASEGHLSGRRAAHRPQRRVARSRQAVRRSASASLMITISCRWCSPRSSTCRQLELASGRAGWWDW